MFLKNIFCKLVNPDIKIVKVRDDELAVRSYDGRVYIAKKEDSTLLNTKNINLMKKMTGCNTKIAGCNTKIEKGRIGRRVVSIQTAESTMKNTKHYKSVDAESKALFFQQIGDCRVEKKSLEKAIQDLKAEKQDEKLKDVNLPGNIEETVENIQKQIQEIQDLSETIENQDIEGLNKKIQMLYKHTKEMSETIKNQGIEGIEQPLSGLRLNIKSIKNQGWNVKNLRDISSILKYKKDIKIVIRIVQDICRIIKQWTVQRQSENIRGKNTGELNRKGSLKQTMQKLPKQEVEKESYLDCVSKEYNGKIYIVKKSDRNLLNDIDVLKSIENADIKKVSENGLVKKLRERVAVIPTKDLSKENQNTRLYYGAASKLETVKETSFLKKRFEKVKNYIKNNTTEIDGLKVAFRKYNGHIVIVAKKNEELLNDAISIWKANPDLEDIETLFAGKLICISTKESLIKNSKSGFYRSLYTYDPGRFMRLGPYNVQINALSIGLGKLKKRASAKPQELENTELLKTFNKENFVHFEHKGLIIVAHKKDGKYAKDFIKFARLDEGKAFKIMPNRDKVAIIPTKESHESRIIAYHNKEIDQLNEKITQYNMRVIVPNQVENPKKADLLEFLKPFKHIESHKSIEECNETIAQYNKEIEKYNEKIMQDKLEEADESELIESFNDIAIVDNKVADSIPIQIKGRKPILVTESGLRAAQHKLIYKKNEVNQWLV